MTPQLTGDGLPDESLGTANPNDAAAATGRLAADLLPVWLEPFVQGRLNELTPDTHGGICLADPDGMIVSFDPRGPDLFLSAYLFPLPLRQGNSIQTLSKLLEANLHQEATDGGSLAFDPRSGEAVLCLRWPDIGQAGPEIFQAALVRFMTRARILTDEFTA